jgi:hypothetical protein
VWSIVCSSKRCKPRTAALSKKSCLYNAALCSNRFMWFMIKVTFGEHDRCNDTRKPESRFVLRAITGDFSFMNFDHDIALLRLNDKVPITDNIRPICLPNNTGEYLQVHSHVSAQFRECQCYKISLPYVIMDVFRHVRFRDVLFPDSSRMTLVRHWHGTDKCELTLTRQPHWRREATIILTCTGLTTCPVGPVSFQLYKLRVLSSVI